MSIFNEYFVKCSQLLVIGHKRNYWLNITAFCSFTIKVW